MGLFRSTFTLRVKLLVAPLLALLLAFLTIWFLISHRVDAALLANENAQISLTGRILMESFYRQLELSKGVMKALVVQEEISEGLFVATNEDDFTNLGGVIKESMIVAGADEAILVRAGGESFFRTSPEGLDYASHVVDLSDAILEHPPIDDPQNQLSEVVSAKVMQIDDTFYLLTFGPLLDVEDIVGVVLFVQKITNAFVDVLKNDLNLRFFDGGATLEASMSTADRIVVSTLAPLSLDQSLHPEKNAFDMSVADRPFRHLFLPLTETGVYLGLSYDVSANAQARAAIRVLMGFIFLVALLVIFAIIFLNVNVIVRSISALLTCTQEISGGNLTRNVDIDSQDEIGILAEAINRMARSLGMTIRTVALQTHTVEVCVSQLVLVKEALSGDARQTNVVAREVVAENNALHHEIMAIQSSVGQAAANMESVTNDANGLANDIMSMAAATEEASANVTTVAQAAESMTESLSSVNAHLNDVHAATNDVMVSLAGMTTSFTEVRQRCDAGKQAAEAANTSAINSSTIMARLQHSAIEIGEVVEMISAVAEQTNMLSLNASIEAAGAGDAGLGFSVVANEIKNLARQTREATETISSKIEEIQTNVQDAGEAGHEIVTMIDSLNHSILGITQAVDQQTHITEGISDAIKGVAQGVGQVTHDAGDLATGAQEVSRAAGEAALGNAEIARTTSQVSIAADAMSSSSLEAQTFAESILEASKRTSQSSAKVQEKMQHSFLLAAYLQGSVEHFEQLTGVVEGTSKALGLAQSGLEIGQAPFDVQQIKGFYLDWGGRLNWAILGRNVWMPEEVADAKECAFGLWYNSEEAQYLVHLPDFQALAVVHENIHQQAKAILQLVADGQKDEAHQLMAGFEKNREKLFALLDVIYQGDTKSPRAIA